jgi:hypothetical protein
MWWNVGQHSKVKVMAFLLFISRLHYTQTTISYIGVCHSHSNDNFDVCYCVSHAITLLFTSMGCSFLGCPRPRLRVVSQWATCLCRLDSAISGISCNHYEFCYSNTVSFISLKQKRFVKLEVAGRPQRGQCRKPA